MRAGRALGGGKLWLACIVSPAVALVAVVALLGLTVGRAASAGAATTSAGRPASRTDQTASQPKTPMLSRNPTARKMAKARRTR